MTTTNESLEQKEKRLARRRASQKFHQGAFRRSMGYQMPNPIRQLLKQKGLTDQEIDAAIKEGEQEFHKGKRNDPTSPR